jgi:hypothetical protein
MRVQRSRPSGSLRAPGIERVRALIATSPGGWLRMPQTVLGGRLVRTQARARRFGAVAAARMPVGLFAPPAAARWPATPAPAVEAGVSRDDLALALDRTKQEVKAELARELLVDAHR